MRLFGCVPHNKYHLRVGIGCEELAIEDDTRGIYDRIYILIVALVAAKASASPKVETDHAVPE